MLTFPQKIGAYIAGQENGLSPEMTEVLLSKRGDNEEVKEMLRKALREIDDKSVKAIQSRRIRKGTKTDRRLAMEELGKQAGALKAAADSAGYLDLLKGVLLSAIATGGIGGAVYNVASRHARDEDVKNESLKRRIKLYRNVHGQLQNLQSAGDL